MKHQEHALKMLKKVKSKGIEADPKLVEDKPPVGMESWVGRTPKNPNPKKKK